MNLLSASATVVRAGLKDGHTRSSGVSSIEEAFHQGIRHITDPASGARALAIGAGQAALSLASRVAPANTLGTAASLASGCHGLDTNAGLASTGLGIVQDGLRIATALGANPSVQTAAGVAFRALRVATPIGVASVMAEMGYQAVTGRSLVGDVAKVGGTALEQTGHSLKNLKAEAGAALLSLHYRPITN